MSSTTALLLLLLSSSSRKKGSLESLGLTPKTMAALFVGELRDEEEEEKG